MHDMAKVVEARGESRHGKGPKVLRELAIQRAENGGHTVEHRYESNGGYREPETYVFGAGDGEKALAHIAKHAAIKSGKKKEEELSKEG